MAWPTGFASFNDITSWDNLFRPLTMAVVERAEGAGACVWPKSNWSYYSGTVTAATETQITDSGATFHPPDMVGPFVDPWNGIRTDPPGVAPHPSSWYICIDDKDPEKVVKVHATVNTTTTITIDNIRDYVTSGQIPSLASLVGKSYYIIRGDYGLWWHERVMEWPNAYEWAAGTVKDLAKAAPPEDTIKPKAPTNKLIRDDGVQWAPNEHKNRELLLYGDDGFLKRVTIKSNTFNTLVFDQQTWTPAIDSPYVVVTAGARAIPGRARNEPWAWYRGKRATFSSHEWNDGLTTAQLPVSTFKIPGVIGPGPECGDVDVPMWDVDFWSHSPAEADDNELVCGRPVDKSYAPHIYKTIRGLQLALEGLCTSYVDPTVDYSGWGLRYIPTLNPAETFKLAGINHFTGSTGNVVGASGNDGTVNNQINVTIGSLAYYPIKVWYSIHEPDGTYKWGRGRMISSSVLESAEGSFVQAYDPGGGDPIVPGDNGLTLVISPGWTRAVERQFKRMYDTPRVFIPDVVTNPETGTQSLIDPPSINDFETTQCLGIGTWEASRVKSTHYIERTQQGGSWADAEGYAWENGDAFADGDVARYVGDNVWDPSIASDLSSSGYSQFSPGGLLDPYYDRYFAGRMHEDYLFLRDQQRMGAATEDGDKTYLRDDSKDFYDFQFFGGIMRTEEGTATGGSKTSLQDTTKAEADQSNPTNPLNCMWQVARFRGENPFLGFTIEIDIPKTDGSGGVDTYQRRITSSDPNAVSVTWTEPLPKGVQNGWAYRVKEPKALNQWKGRTIRIRRLNSDGTRSIATTTVTGNSQDTLYFTALPWTVTKGTTYWIEEVLIGSVMKWDAAHSKWTFPSGPDSHRLMVGASQALHDFHAHPFDNFPHYQKRFGKFMCADAITKEVFDELYRFLNVLLWVKWDVSWAAEAVDGTPENNGASAAGADSGCGGTGFGCPDTDTCETAKAGAVAGWVPVPSGAAEPFAVAGSNFAQFGDPCYADDGCHEYGIERLYAYGKVDSICTRQACAVDYYNYASGPGGANTTVGCPGGSEIVFNSYGDPVAYHSWTNWASASAWVRSTDRRKLGSNSAPDGSYANGITCFHREEGYMVMDALAILRWDVAGGFTYRP